LRQRQLSTWPEAKILADGPVGPVTGAMRLTRVVRPR